MAAAKKKKGFIYRIGFVFGRLSARYRRLEEPVICWMLKKGMPATLASLLSGLIRLALIGVFLYLAFWAVVAAIGLILCKEILLNSSEVEKKEEIVWVDPENLFPDPYSLDNRIDPVFHRDI